MRRVPGLWLGGALCLIALHASAAGSEAVAPERTVRVTLREAGSEPRRLLRLTPAKGDTQTMVMTMTMEMAMVVAGFSPPPQKLPPMQTTMELEVTDVSTDGDVAYTFTTTKAEVLPAEGVPEAMVSMLETRLGSMEGMAGKGLMTSQGFTKEAEIEIPENADAQVRQLLESMKQSLDQFSTPYPEEPVGVGASWTVEIPTEQGGISSVITATYTLTKMSDEGCTLGVEMEQTAASQEVENEQLPPGTAMHLDDLQANGTGTLQVTFGRMAPTKSAMRMRSAMKTTIEAGGQKQPMTMKSDIVVELDGKD